MEMITLEQAQKVEFGEELNQSDIDELNKFNCNDYMKLQYAASWAYQYYYESIVDAKSHKRFCNIAYGND